MTGILIVLLVLVILNLIIMLKVQNIENMAIWLIGALTGENNNDEEDSPRGGEG